MISKSSSTKWSQSWMKVPMPNLRSCSVTFQLFSPKMNGDIGKCDLVHQSLQVHPGSSPVKLPHRQTPMHFKTDLQKPDKFLQHELIEPCHSSYSSPVMLVPKKNGKVRLVIDYRQLNKQTIKSCWPISSIEKIFDTSEGNCYFSIIDRSRGFYQLPMEEANQDYTAFSTPFGSFKWLRMPMGFTGSPNIFLSLMEEVPVSLTWKFTIPYLDDCMIFYRAIEERLERLREFFKGSKTPISKSIQPNVGFSGRKYPFWAYCEPWRHPGRSGKNIWYQRTLRSQKFHRPLSIL